MSKSDLAQSKAKSLQEVSQRLEIWVKLPNKEHGPFLLYRMNFAPLLRHNSDIAAN
jgi:hypothetical protein